MKPSYQPAHRTELLQSHPAGIRLDVACIGTVNTVRRPMQASLDQPLPLPPGQPLPAPANDANNNQAPAINFPRFYGAAVELRTGQVFPASFSRDQPLLLLRHSRLYGKPSPGLNRLWDAVGRCIHIEPFDYKPTPSRFF